MVNSFLARSTIFSQLLRLRQPILFMEYFLILPFYLFSFLPLPPPCNPLSSSFSPLLPFLSLLCETHFYNIFYYVLTSPGIRRLKIPAGFCLSLTLTQFGLMCTYAHNGKSSYTHRGVVEFYRYRAWYSRIKKWKRESCTFLFLKLLTAMRMFIPCSVHPKEYLFNAK